jgi:hypothetical protein
LVARSEAQRVHPREPTRTSDPQSGQMK